MKKSLLLAAAAIIAVSASAQMRVQQRPAQITKQAVSADQYKNVLIKDAQQLTGPRKAAPKKVRPAEAPKYRRPAGVFYGAFSTDLRGYGNVLLGKPYSNYEFKNMSEMPATDWKYWLYNSTTQANDEFDYSGTDFSYTYGYTAVPCPTLYAGDYSYSATQTTDKGEGGAIATENGEVWSVVNATDLYGSNLPSNYLATPHFTSGTRYEDENMGYAFTTYTGALDANGGRTGYWFGKNFSGFNGYALGVEKPTTPYVLNRVYAYASRINITGDVELTCRVYRLPELPQYSDDGAVIDPEIFTDDNLIASGTYTLTKAALGEKTSLMMPFDLEQYDPELEMSYQVTPEIDCPILIVISGYDSDNVNTLAFMITCEDEDEGWGEHAYNLQIQDGVITLCHGLDNFFLASEETGEGLQMKVGPSIFMDVSMPFLVYNFDDETGEYKFPNEGGSYYTLGNSNYEGVYLFGVDQYSADVKAESIFYSLEDGSEVPDWLTIELMDEQYQTEDGQTGTVPKAVVNCAALPEGVQGREANVKFYINGAYVIYHFSQGEAGPGPDPRQPGDYNNDGQVDIADVNTAIDMMLGKVAQDLILDMNGDGAVDIADINALIDKMLGK